MTAHKGMMKYLYVRKYQEPQYAELLPLQAGKQEIGLFQVWLAGIRKAKIVNMDIGIGNIFIFF